MTRPTPTQGAQSEAARVPRVSDATFSAICDRAAYDAQLDDATTFQMIALDSRDKDAMIADLERRLAEANLGVSERARGTGVATISRQDLNNMLEEREKLKARADALQAWLTEAEQRAATAERRGFEAGRDASEAVAQRHADGLGNPARLDTEAAQDIADAIRALAPAVPQEGETTP